MRRAILAGAVVATVAAFYGLSGAPSAPPHPMQSATPGEVCWHAGAIGAFGDRAYVCDEGRWRQFP
jgi:hypothetical protein